MAGKKTEGAKKSGALSKSALINAVVEETGDVSRKQVKTVLRIIADIGWGAQEVGNLHRPRFREIPCREEAGDEGTPGHQPVHEAAADGVRR